MAGYLFLLLLCAVLFSAGLWFGLREWIRPHDATPLLVDVEYVRTENYFGASFREKLEGWMKAGRTLFPSPAPDPVLQKTIGGPNGDRILLLRTGRLEGGAPHQEIICSEGDLQLASGSVFHREIYCRGVAVVEGGVRLQAVAADEDVVLGPQCKVSRWVDAYGKVVLGRGASVGSRASAREAIEMKPGAVAQSLYAPLVFTSGTSGTSGDSPAAPGNTPEPAEAPQRSQPDGMLPSYLATARASQLSPGAWLVRGNLELAADSRVDGPLVVQGTLRTGPDCVFAASVKAKQVALGRGNRVVGSLVSAGSLEIGESSFVEENVAAEADILLRRHVRVGRSGALAAVCAGGKIQLEKDVAVCGKLVAGRGVAALEKEHET